MTTAQELAANFEASAAAGALHCSQGGIPFNNAHIEYWKSRALKAEARQAAAPQGREAIPRADSQNAKDGWRLDYKSLEKLCREVEKATGYQVTMECAEEIVLRTEAALTPVVAPDGAGEDYRETVKILLDLLNPLHGSLDRQVSNQLTDEREIEPPRDREYNVDITVQQERDLTQAVCILENRRTALAQAQEPGEDK